MSEQEGVEDVVEALTACLAALDRMGADISAAHVDAALQALCRWSDPIRYVSETE